MKRLAWLIIIIALPVICYFQYKKYTRFHPPSMYEYVSQDSVDINYFDPMIVQQYFENIYKLEGITRQLWFSKGLDVKFPDLNIEGSRREVDYYNQLYATTKLLEKKLIYSSQLKGNGFQNFEIKEMVEKGISPKLYTFLKKKKLIGLHQGQELSEVWELQKLLLDKSYEIPFDGVFGIETKESLVDFQTKNSLMPTGIVDESTLKHLIK